MSKIYYQSKDTNKKTRTGFDCYVADHPLQEIAGDIANFTESAKDHSNYRYAWVCIDIFTKYAVAIPMKSKTSDECTESMKKS